VDAVSKDDVALEDSAKVKVTISVGVASFPDDANTKEGLVKTADKALYQAKKLGKNRACMFGAADQ